MFTTDCEPVRGGSLSHAEGTDLILHGGKLNFPENHGQPKLAQCMVLVGKKGASAHKKEKKSMSTSGEDGGGFKSQAGPNLPPPSPPSLLRYLPFAPPMEKERRKTIDMKIRAPFCRVQSAATTSLTADIRGTTNESAHACLRGSTASRRDQSHKHSTNTQHRLSMNAHRVLCCQRVSPATKSTQLCKDKAAQSPSTSGLSERICATRRTAAKQSS